MKNFNYSSSLATEMREFVLFKQRQGFDYSGQGLSLLEFDHFLVKSKFDDGILDEIIMEEYAAELKTYAPVTRVNRFSVVKEFSLYLAMFNPASYVLMKNPFRAPSRERSYIFTHDEIDTLLREALARLSRPREQSLNYYIIIGLLAFTGIRVQECLNLNVGDWNEESSLLFIKRGKFGKDRVIPVDSSIKEKIVFFIQRKSKLEELHDDTPLFVGKSRNRLRQDCFRKIFSKLLDESGIDRHPLNSMPPTIHSLRHTFAVNNIIKWIRQGKDVNAMLPYLAKYMGHVTVTSTQVYLQCVEEHRREAANKFNNLFSKCIK